MRPASRRSSHAQKVAGSTRGAANCQMYGASGRSVIGGPKSSTAPAHHGRSGVLAYDSRRSTSTPASGHVAASIDSHARVIEAQRFTTVGGSERKGNQIAPAAAEVMPGPKAAATTRTSYPASTRASAVVSPITPAPTTVTRAMPPA